MEKISKEEYEKMSTEEKIEFYLEHASGRTELDVTPAAQILSEMLQNGELLGLEIKDIFIDEDKKHIDGSIEISTEKLNNGINCVLPYPIGTYLVKKENNGEHIDLVYKYIISFQGISVILLLDVLTNSRESTEISLDKLINEWKISDINFLDRETDLVKTLKK